MLIPRYNQILWYSHHNDLKCVELNKVSISVVKDCSQSVGPKAAERGHSNHLMKCMIVILHTVKGDTASSSLLYLSY